jgi:hypothetical protein
VVPGRTALIGCKPGQEGGRSHDQRHMAMPAVPGAGLAAIKAKVVFGA